MDITLRKTQPVKAMMLGHLLVQEKLPKTIAGHNQAADRDRVLPPRIDVP
jgi:hypothetical protein